jgi:GxxExxY protein
MSASSSKTRYIHCGKFQYQSGGDERTGKLTAEENGWLEKYEKKKGKEMIKVDKLCIKMLYETIEKKDKEIAKQTEQINKLKEKIKRKMEETKQNAAEKKQAKLDKKNMKLNKWQCQIPKTPMVISEIASQVFQIFQYGGKEHHFQALLEHELRKQGYCVHQETAVIYKVNTISGETIQLPHDIRGREDLLLPSEKMIIELKQTKLLGNKEHQQLIRYMHQRYTYSDWGTETKGMLINFGDEDFEAWFVQYTDEGALEHIKIKSFSREIYKSWEENAYVL